MLTFHQCCDAIVTNRKEKALNYAVNYARAGFSMDETSHEAKV